MIRKILHIVFWLLILSWFIIILGFISDKSSEIMCKRISIEVSDSSEVKFITTANVWEMIKETDIDIQGYPVSEINTRHLERSLERNPYVENAEAYITVDGDLYLKVEQRKPVVRVMPQGRGGFYIDSNGEFLPLSSSYSPMVLLVTGNLFVPENIRLEGLQHKDSVDTEHSYLFEVLDFARYIDTHPFWKQQIVQIYRDRAGDYELIPRVGAHQILFGTMENYEEKLRNLKLLYEQGFQMYGWNNYSKINLKYSNQVICTKR
ncbi:cell division protein FtsQ/DivIB [Bacteroidota bacterium]